MNTTRLREAIKVLERTIHVRPSEAVEHFEAFKIVESVADTLDSLEISDEEINARAKARYPEKNQDDEYYIFFEGAKWYRQALRDKLNKL